MSLYASLSLSPSGLAIKAKVLFDGYWWAQADINRERVVQDRRTGMSLTLVARKHSVSRATVCRLMKEFNENSASAVLLSDGNLTKHSADVGSAR
jgi:hypothetical protein